MDSNPIAVQIANAKISNFDVKQSIDKIKEIIEGIDLKKKKKMSDKATRFFHEETANQIMHLKEFYDDFNDYEKAAFLGAICLSARGCNNYKWSSTQIGKAAEVKNNIDFFSKFLMKLKKHAHPVNPNNSKIHHGDARKMSEFIKKGSVDFVYTSPPYFDALDYTSNYTRIVHDIFENDVSKLKKSLIQSFDSYAKDMKNCFNEIKKVTSNNAVIIFVVGDKKKGNKVIKGGEFFKEIIKEKPSYVIEREYSGTASKIWDKINNTQRKEQIIVWDKSKW